jgi:uncharacterized oxidoreductase
MNRKAMHLAHQTKEIVMKITGNTVLITGGATGIGLALAKHFLAAGNEVVICGRRELRLNEAKNLLSRLHTYPCDISTDKGRQTLLSFIKSKFPHVNVVVNNAGIQRAVDFKKGPEDLLNSGNEIETNFTAPVYLSAYFTPLLLQQKEAAIINISSGLAFVPLAVVPVYCATKAAIHSLSLSLRHQMKRTPIKVFEIIAPIVDTELDQGARQRRGQRERGIPPEEVASATLKALENDHFEVAIGMAQNLVTGSRTNPDQAFTNMNH